MTKKQVGIKNFADMKFLNFYSKVDHKMRISISCKIWHLFNPCEEDGLQVLEKSFATSSSAHLNEFESFWSKFLNV